jgi:hypothetical protein
MRTTKGDHQRVAIDAGTALEHLSKACLARRSPALLTELKPGNWASLALLCGYPEGNPRQLRTVGLREAHERLKIFVSSVASEMRTMHSQMIGQSLTAACYGRNLEHQ